VHEKNCNRPNDLYPEKVALIRVILILVEMEKIQHGGIGARLRANDLLERYIIARLAFMRALCSVLGMERITLYRGMSSDSWWKSNSRTWSSWTPIIHVARCHADFDSFGQHRGASTDF